MRVWFFTPAYPPFAGGGERYAAALADALTARGCTVTVITTAAQVEADFWRGRAEGGAEPGSVRLPLRPWPGGRRGLLLWRKAMVTAGAWPGVTALLRRMARRVPPAVGLEAAVAGLPRPDIVHGFNISWEHFLLASVAWGERLNVPRVATPFMHFGAGGRVARNSLMPHQLAALRACDAVFALTEFEKERLARHGVPAARLHAVGGGADPLPAAGVAPAPAQGDAPYALFIGRLSADKGAIDAARAAARLARPLLLVGTPSAEWDRFYTTLDAAARRWVRPLGRVDEATKHALLAGCMMLVLPSRVESFGIVLLEAWAHGRPVIGADAGSLPEMIADGETGLLVPAGDREALTRAMSRLFDAPDLARRLGAAGYQVREKRFQWPAVAERVLTVYRALTEGGA